MLTGFVRQHRLVHGDQVDELHPGQLVDAPALPGKRDRARGVEADHSAAPDVIWMRGTPVARAAG
jgi:hypothetical protein